MPVNRSLYSVSLISYGWLAICCQTLNGDSNKKQTYQYIPNHHPKTKVKTKNCQGRLNVTLKPSPEWSGTFREHRFIKKLKLSKNKLCRIKKQH